MKIAFIGGGNMGEAMLSALLRKELAASGEVAVADVKLERRDHLKAKYGVKVTENNLQSLFGAEVVVLAIKPQNLSAVMAELAGYLKPDQLVLSIIAGARIATISGGLKHRSIVRVMPNTPAQIGEGMSVWTATPQVSSPQKSLAAAILGAMGNEIFVDDEKYLDMATAVSGSGPAYFFFVMEALVEGAVEIGLNREVARELVLHTMLGSGHLLERSGKEPAELRRQVTSPGGTTAEAIAYLEKGDFPRLLAGAVRAAYEKAKQLGG
jgi:pyrroline-5-carboxylate reductase